jgi:hypothetical protein
MGRHTRETAVRIDTNNIRLPLVPKRHAQLDNARNVRLTGLEGMTWITVDGELCDVFIGPGESFVVPSDGKVVAAAIDGPALIELTGCAGAVRSGPAARWAPWLHGLRRLSSLVF